MVDVLKEDGGNSSKNDKVKTRVNNNQFTLYFNPLHQKIRQKKRRERDRALANKIVTWRLYRKYWQSSKYSLVQTVLIAGIAPFAVIVGVSMILWGIGEHDEVRDEFRNLATSPTNFFIVNYITGILFIVSGLALYLGLVAQKLSRLLLCVSFPGFILSFIFTIASIAMILHQSSKSSLIIYLKTLMASYRHDGSGVETRVLDRIHELFSCCGATGPEDWAKGNVSDVILPTSCCFSYANSSGSKRPCQYLTNVNDTQNVDLKTKGCHIPLREFLTLNDANGWTWITMGFFASILASVVILWHLRRTGRRTRKFLRPALWKLLDTILNEALNSLRSQDENYAQDVKQFTWKCLEQCHNTDQVKKLLCTVGDVLYFIQYQKPINLAYYIMQGKPILVVQFENGLAAEKENRIIAKHQQGKKPLAPANTVESIRAINSTVRSTVEKADMTPFSDTKIARNEDVRGKTSVLVSSREMNRRMENVERFLNDFYAHRIKVFPGKSNGKGHSSAGKSRRELKKKDISIDKNPICWAKDLERFRRVTFGSTGRKPS